MISMKYYVEYPEELASIYLPGHSTKASKDTRPIFM